MKATMTKNKKQKGENTYTQISRRGGKRGNYNCYRMILRRGRG